MKKELTVVRIGRIEIPIDTVTDRSDLGPFIRAYLRTGLKHQRLVGNTIEDLTDSVIAQAQHDCLQFYWANRHDLELMFINDPEYSTKLAGKDFWLARHSQTKGFVQRSFADEADRVQASAYGFGKLRLVALDDGRVAMRWPNEQTVQG